MTKIVDVAGAGCSVDNLIPARIRVETLHAICAGGLCVGRVYLAACIEGGFEICLVVLWTALDYGSGVSLACLGASSESWNTSRG